MVKTFEDGALLMARTEGGAFPRKGQLAAHGTIASGFTCKIRKSTAFEDGDFHRPNETAIILLQAPMRNEITLGEHFPKDERDQFIRLK